MSTKQHWPPPDTTSCSQCKGLGKYRGLFGSSTCAQCDGTGITDDNGNPLPREDSVVRLAQQLKTEQRRYRQLLNTPGVREAVADHEIKVAESRHERALGYGSARYQGD